MTPREREFILERDLCRLATISSRGWPHVVPVGYIFVHEKFIIPSNRGTKKTENVVREGRLTLVVDDEIVRNGRRHGVGVMLYCKARLVEKKQREIWKRYLTEKKGWEESEMTLIIEAKPVRKASWGLSNTDLSRG